MSCDYFLKEENCEKYIEMVKDFDISFMCEKFRKNVNKKSHVLELGSGPGKDLVELSKDYVVTGSDYSEVFKMKFHKSYPSSKIDYLVVDAIEMKGVDSNKFDVIYSNKVLHHLTKEEFVKSLKNQKNYLKKDGILFHTLWIGKKDEVNDFNGVRFAVYKKESLELLMKDTGYKILKMETYTEMEEGDSIIVISKVMDV